MRTEAIEGVGGPQLGVFDHYSGASLLVSSDLNGERGWRDLQGVFRTGPDAKLVVLRVVRVPGATRMRGKLWLDEVEVYPK